MALFKLKTMGGDVSQAELVTASHSSLALEKHLECWLEKSPWAIAEEPLLVVGRQASASVESGTIFPDLLALDKDGNLVVAELKKGKAPREVVAQLLEYAAWASELSQQRIEELAAVYLGNTSNRSLCDAFCEIFETDSVPILNQVQRLFVTAEEIPPSVARVCRFLRTSHGMDINCVEFSVFQTESGEILVTSDWIVGHEDVASSKQVSGNRWAGDKSVKQVVWDAVQELTCGDRAFVFSPKDVTQVVLKHYPEFNKSTVGCQIISDCVNHTSRHHYPGGEERYWWLEKGKYRLFDPLKDKSRRGVP